jgi:hypothetical protein
VGLDDFLRARSPVGLGNEMDVGSFGGVLAATIAAVGLPQLAPASESASRLPFFEDGRPRAASMASCGCSAVMMDALRCCPHVRVVDDGLVFNGSDVRRRYGFSIRVKKERSLEHHRVP